MTRLSGTIGLGQVEKNRLQNIFHHALELDAYLPTKPNFTCVFKNDRHKRSVLGISIHHIITAVKQNQFYFGHVVRKQLTPRTHKLATDSFRGLWAKETDVTRWCHHCSHGRNYFASSSQCSCRFLKGHSCCGCEILSCELKVKAQKQPMNWGMMGV